jgi:hypothetical protein
MSSVLKAYREEKAIRRGLELYVKKETGVFEELERLKR